jgi:aprataxin
MSKLDANTCERLLKEDLACWHCGSGMKNMPVLKAHLQEEWDKQAKQERAKPDRKTLMQKRVAAELETAPEAEQPKKARLEA